MAEAVVSMVAEQFLTASKELIMEEISLIRGVKKEVENVSSKLQTIQHVLDDAEKRSMKEKAVQGWLEKLKDISYEMEDVLDKWNTAISKQKFEEAENPSIPGEKISCSSWLTRLPFKQNPCFPLKQVGLRREIARKIKDISTELDSIIKEKNDFNFVYEGSLPNTSLSSFQSERITSSLIDESEVCGRGDDEKTLLSMLLSESNQEENQIPTISIVGTGGLGKTTLARLIYNNDEVKKRFSTERIWVCVSDPFDLCKIAAEVVKAIGGNTPNDPSKEQLLQCLKHTITNKKFLLVLDDVWDEKGEKWEELKICLKVGAIGSRVLITTRKEKVARVMGTSTTNLYHLGKLSESGSWSLFCKLAFAEKKDHEMQVREIGEKIVEKCKGLPLAIKTIGSLLRFKYTFEGWKQVLDSEIWQLEEMEEDVFPHLYLSYKELPSIVKRCFLYCSIFPKDTELDVEKLIRFWLAQGLVKSTNGMYDKELKGKEHFNKLVMCSFFQDFKEDQLRNIHKCKMHDIVHDFAQYLARNECITIGNVKSNSYPKRARHLTWFPGLELESVLSSCDVGRLCTFIVDKHSVKLPVTLFNRLKRVRVLILKNCGLKKLPEEVGSLFHLRCLDLSENGYLDRLPESVCELYNLETLNLKYCSSLSLLPQRIGRLINLRELFISKTSLKEYPECFQKLTNLRILHHFLVGKRFGKLEHLNHFKNLRRLKIKAGNDSSETDDQELNVEIATLEAQQPLLNVDKLVIVGISGTHFSSWLVKAFNNLKQLEIQRCNCSTLPPLWKLPNLEILRMFFMNKVQRIGREFLGIPDTTTPNDDSLRRAPASSSSVCVFPKLVELNIYEFPELQVWEETDQEDKDTTFEIMPQLRRLEIHLCPKLHELPNWLRAKVSIQGFFIYACPNLIRSYPEFDGHYFTYTWGARPSEQAAATCSLM